MSYGRVRPADGTRAWKFLDERSRGVFSELAWPLPPVRGGPGPWVEADGPIEPCTRGIHACRPEDLAWWLSAQLWEVELAAPLLATDHGLVAARGRLTRRIEAWPDVGAELADWAVGRTRDRTVEARRAVDRAGAGALATCVDLDELAAAVALLPPAMDRRATLAAIFLADNVTDRPNPVTACHTAARAAGQLAAFNDDDATTYGRAFMAERQAQGRWLADRLGLPPRP